MARGRLPLPSAGHVDYSPSVTGAATLRLHALVGLERPVQSVGTTFRRTLDFRRVPGGIAFWLSTRHLQPCPLVTITERIRIWRSDAAVLRDYGDERAAELLERLATDLEADLQDGAAEMVGFSAAVTLTGYTRGHLRRLLIEGKLRNVGTHEEPAFLTSELPRKPGQPNSNSALAPRTRPSPSLRMQVARAVASRG